MTRSEFEARVDEWVTAKRALQHRYDQAIALGLRLKGWVLTHDEAFRVPIASSTRWPGGVVYLGPEYPTLPIVRIIPERA